MGPHTLALDQRGRLFVADRSNSRIQIFDQDMTYLDSWKHFGRPSGIIIVKNDKGRTLREWPPTRREISLRA